MADITAGEVWSDGQTVTGARLNNHVNGSVIQPAFVSGKTLVTPALGDSIVIYQGTTLKRATLSSVVGLGGAGTVTSVGLTMPTDTFSTVVGSPVTGTGTLAVSHKSQSQGEVLIGPAGAAGVPTWRRIEARDTWKTAVNIAASVIDWNLGDVFYKVVTVTPQGFTMSNNESGRSIDVILHNNIVSGPVINWQAGIYWPGGVKPTHTTGNGKVDWYRFTQYGSNVFGVRLGADLHYP